MMQRRAIAAGALAILLAMTAASPAWAADDGFAAFWAKFSAAAAANDRVAVEGMTKLDSGYGDGSPGSAKTFAQYYTLYLTPKVRRCLGKAKPTRDVDGENAVNYEAFCGEGIYVFSKRGGAWRFVEIGAND
jgi:hypothetical protein